MSCPGSHLRLWRWFLLPSTMSWPALFQLRGTAYLCLLFYCLRFHSVFASTNGSVADVVLDRETLLKRSHDSLPWAATRMRLGKSCTTLEISRTRWPSSRVS